MAIFNSYVKSLRFCGTTRQLYLLEDLFQLPRRLASLVKNHGGCGENPHSIETIHMGCSILKGWDYIGIIIHQVNNLIALFNTAEKNGARKGFSNPHSYTMVSRVSNYHPPKHNQLGQN